MTSASSSSPARGLLVMGLVLGIISGLVEGVVHMVLHRLDVLDNTWYPIIWIAGVVNGVLLGGAGLVWSVISSRRPHGSWIRAVAIFSLFLLAVVPVLALFLKEWIYKYAIFLLCVGIATALTRWQLGRPSWTFARRGVVMWSVGSLLVAFALIEGGGRLQEQRSVDRLPAASPSSPDVLLVIVDTLRSDHLSSYGYSRQTSPGIDALAAEGVIFENGFATSSYTLPSHVSILTGQRPRDHQVEWDSSHRWPTAPPTLPEVLQSRGYRTGAFSANTFYFTREHQFGRGFVHFEDFFHSIADRVWRTAYGSIATRVIRPRLGWDDLPARKRAPEVSDAASRWIARDADRPFFVALNYMDTHDPYLPPQPYRSRFSSQQNPGGLINSKWHIPRTLTPEQLQGELDAYDGAIAFVDDHVSRLVAAVRAMGRSRPLVVILTSDHGEEFGEHGGFLHQRHLYREVIQVPLIIWGPGLVSSARVTQPVSNASIPATVMDLIGGPSPFPEPSLLAISQGGAGSAAPVISELKHMPWAWPSDAPIKTGSMRSVVDDRWHYIEHDARAPELFDRKADPQERTNLRATPEAEPVIGQMKRLIK